MKRNSDIAIIGISCRFPGARSITELWNNLTEGRESVLFNQNKVVNDNPNYVNVSASLANIFDFDSQFFDFSYEEACKIDPNSRLALTSAWEAFEDAGYNPLNMNESVGVFMGTCGSYYFLNNVLPTIHDKVRIFQNTEYFYNCSDFISTIISYKLNLNGPSLSLQSFCSSSLSAIHYACKSILEGECSMAISGGVHALLPDKIGYYYKKDDIYSKDGHCRIFDSENHGIVFGNGVGIVLLKRFKEALKDGDHIYAIIKGSYINNDGSKKLSYFSPSKDGQVKLISNGLKNSNVTIDDISYIEAHGTGTIMGDRIEIKALNEVFNKSTKYYKNEKCYIGSIKPNIGHLGAAAGVAGLIKVALSLKNKLIPPSININTLRPEVKQSGKMEINTRLVDWNTDKLPRRALVNAFGFGGTNVSIVMEEAPVQNSVKRNLKPFQIILISGIRTEDVQKLFELYKHFIISDNINIDDFSFTTVVGRKHFSFRMFVIVDILSRVITHISEIKFSEINSDNNGADIKWNKELGTYEKYLKQLGNLWLEGNNVNWSHLWRGCKQKRISAPTYPFNEKNHELMINL